MIKGKKLEVPSVHAVIIGSDMNAQTKFESELRNYVMQKKIQDRVHFVNKTLTVAPYLAAIDVLVQNSQVVFVHACKVIIYSTQKLLVCLDKRAQSCDFFIYFHCHARKQRACVIYLKIILPEKNWKELANDVNMQAHHDCV